MVLRKTTEQYNCEIAHLDIFPVEDYKGSNTSIIHECINGHQWKAYPTNILRGKGCPICNGHHKKDYDGGPYKVLETYVDRNTPILHECEKGHRWKVRPSHILSGCKCPDCATYGFKKSEPALLYYVRLTKSNTAYYKVGVTNRSIDERFRSEKVSVEILKELIVDTGREALELEQAIFNRNPPIRVEGFLKSGFTELFTEPLNEEILNGRETNSTGT